MDNNVTFTWAPGLDEEMKNVKIEFIFEEKTND